MTIKSDIAFLFFLACGGFYNDNFVAKYCMQPRGNTGSYISQNSLDLCQRQRALVESTFLKRRRGKKITDATVSIHSVKSHLRVKCSKFACHLVSLCKCCLGERTVPKMVMFSLTAYFSTAGINF